MINQKTFISKTVDAIIVIVLSIISLSCILPIWYTLCISISEKSGVAAGLVVLWPVKPTLVSYTQILNDGRFFTAFFISVKRVLLACSLTFITVVMMAYPLSKTNKHFAGRNIFMWILIFTMIFNGGLIPWYMTIKSYGLLNNIWALVLGGSVPMFNVILVVNFFRNLPKELEEAAVVDGAGPWYILFRLYVPLSVPVLATIMLFTFVGHWNEFFSGLILMTKQESYPLQTYIQQLVVVINTSNMTEDQYKMLDAMSNQTLNAAKLFIAMIPVLAVYPFLQRYFITGITLGSVKG